MGEREKILSDFLGERCDTFDPTCPTCIAFGLLDENQKMQKALKPFADLADEIEHCASQYTAGSPESDVRAWFKGCQWEDLLQAREAIKFDPPSPTALENADG